MKFKDIEKPLLYILFLATLIFFIWQRSAGLSWDFMSYTLNAKYFFSNSWYIEWYRAPLAPVLIGIFSFLTWKAAEYVFVILITSLHFFTCIKFAEKYNMNKLFFYSLCLSPAVFLGGLSVGTELLSISLLMLCFVYLDNIGLFLALAVLTRYTSIIFLPLALFLKKWKKILKNAVIFIIPIALWLLYNYFTTGNPLTSITNSYALNVKFRSYYIMPFSFYHLFIIGNYLWVFFIIGFYKKVKNLKKIDYMVLAFMALVIFSYARVPHKEPRYLFNLLFPLAYFGYYSIKNFKFKKIIIIITFLLAIISMFGVANYYQAENPSIYISAIEKIDNCSLASNNWVHLNYLGRKTIPFPPEEMVKKYIDEGYRIILFYNNIEPSYTHNQEFLSTLPIIHEEDRFIILGDKNKCKDINSIKYDSTYLERFRDKIRFLTNQEADISPKAILPF